MGKRKANARLRHACNTLLMGILVCIVGVFGARMLGSGAPAAEGPGAEAAGAETPRACLHGCGGCGAWGR